MNSIALIAAETPLTTRLIVAAVCLLGGLFLIFSGRQAIKTGVAQETGKGRLVNSAIGRSNTYTGKTAAFMGWMRIAGGLAIGAFGVVFGFVGAFLGE